MRASHSGRSIASSLIVTLALLAGGAVALAAPGSSRVSSVASEKAAIEASYDAQRRAAPTNGPASAKVAQRPLSASTPEPWPAGIFDESEAPFPAGRYVIVNRWQLDFGGHHVVVYAGALGTDPSQGVLVVMVYAMDSSTVSIHEIRSAGRQGALRIGSALGRNLTVRPATGAALTFDAEAVRFLP